MSTSTTTKSTPAGGRAKERPTEPPVAAGEKAPVKPSGDKKATGDKVSGDTQTTGAVKSSDAKPGEKPDEQAAAPNQPDANLPPLRPLCTEVATDARGVVLSVDPSFTAILGWGPREIVGRRIGSLVHHDDLPRGLAVWSQLLQRPGRSTSGLRVRYRHHDGGWVWMDVTNRNRLDDPEHTDVMCELVDVSKEVAVQDQLRAKEQLLEQVNEAVPVGLFQAETDGRLLYVNQRLTVMTGVARAVTLGEQLSAVLDADRARLRAAIQGATGGSETGVEIAATEPNGGQRRWSVSLRPMRDASGAVAGITGCIQDVSALTASPNAPRAKVTTDALTGCVTQEAMLVTLGEMIGRHRPTPLPNAQWAGATKSSSSRSSSSSRGTAVLMIDIDGLQAINDRYGQAAGDELLTVVALRIIDSVRSSDVVARVGGDEFAVLCGGVPGPTTALTIGQSTLEQVSQPVQLKTAGAVSFKVHMGVSWTNRPDLPPAQLVHQAAEAMAASKVALATEPVLSGVS
jgi:diguanylate cyclase (GGDEF)-like protein/PAS domain S-box-containing protein